MAESSRETMTESQRPEVDIGLVKAAKGDPRAFAELYQSFVEPVFRYLYSRTGNVHDAEDAFETIASLRQEEHLASWLFSIARHKVMDQYRTQKRIVSIDFVAEITTEKDPLSEVIRSEQSATLAQLIAALPEDERELLRLRFLASLSFPEMARLLRRNEEAVKKSLYRLLARLHDQVEVTHD
jgi:RNA polymerase sigma-70 factor (ECF subfamily)